MSAEIELRPLEGFPGAVRIEPEPYARLSWPRFPKLMKFRVTRWQVPGFGHIMQMQTRAMGLMKLTTLSYTPNQGGRVPYLLIDTMSVGNKRVVFVEFYDCTAQGVHSPALEQLEEAFRSLPDYEEKPAWYVKERMKGSLIKGGKGADGAVLSQMAQEALARYAALVKTAPRDPENLTGLAEFAKRMIREGNPSSATMERVLGTAGAEQFFRTAVMPVNDTE